MSMKRLTSIAIVISCLCAQGIVALAEDVVPQSVSTFEGKIGKTSKDSVPSWPGDVPLAVDPPRVTAPRSRVI